MWENIANKTFIISASRDRVWDLLPTVVFNSAGLEKISIINERRFNAETRLKFAFTNIPVTLFGQIESISELENMTVIIEGKAIQGIVSLSQKIAVLLSSDNNNETKVAIEASIKRSSSILKPIYIRKAQELIITILNSIEQSLKRLA